jgi:hypothetical protein
MRARECGRYGWVRIADLRLVARARGLDVPAAASRDEIVALLQSRDRHPSASTAPHSTATTSTYRNPRPTQTDPHAT